MDKPTGFAPAAFFGLLPAREDAFFKSTFLAVVFLEVVFFAAGFFPTAFRVGLLFFAGTLVSLVFLLDFFLAAIIAVYHRHNQALKTQSDLQKANRGGSVQL